MKNFQRWYLLGRTSVGFCDVDLHFVVVVVVVVILHLLIFFIHIFFSTSSLTLSWTIARFLKLILNFQPSPEWSRHFHFSTIPLSSYLERYGFEWAFFTHRRFLPYAPSDIFGTFPTLWHNLLLSRFHWEPAANFLKVAGLHNDSPNTDPAHLFVWFTVIHNLLYILTSYLCMSILQEFLLVVKTLIRSAATLFSNHENIK